MLSNFNSLKKFCKEISSDFSTSIYFETLSIISYVFNVSKKTFDGLTIDSGVFLRYLLVLYC